MNQPLPGTVRIQLDVPVAGGSGPEVMVTEPSSSVSTFAKLLDFDRSWKPTDITPTVSF